MVLESQTKERSARTARVLAIPIFCGIFSFCHWFIFFPLMWTYLSKHGMKRFWLFALVVFLMWLLVMALCLCCWWYDKKRQTPIHRTVQNTTSILEYNTKDNSNSPILKTKSSAVQPGYKGTSTGDFDSEKEILCMRSIPIQPQNTPALYNLHTGRHSFDSTDIRNSFDSAQKVQPDQISKEVLLVKKETNHKFVNISSSDSDQSSKTTLNEHPGGYELLLTTDTEKKQKVKNNKNHTVQAIIEQPIHEQEIHLRTKHDHCATAQEPTKVQLSSDSDDEELFKHIDMDIRLSDQNISSRDPSGRLYSQSGEIEHLKECGTPDADKLSQNMPMFDDYLHIVSIETPMSPREVFFSDLIKQANETEQNLLRNNEGGGDRRSYCIGDITHNKLNYDDRKSVPLFLYSDQWRQEGQTPDDGEVPEQNVDSDDNQEVDQVIVEPEKETSQEIEHIRQPEPKECEVKVVELSPKKKDCEDLKMLTQMFINEEKLKSCSSPIITPPTSFNRDVEQIDDTHLPRFPKVKPLKFTEGVDNQVTKPKTKPVIEMKEITEPEFQKSRAKAGCCEDEPDLPKHKEKKMSTGNKRESLSEYFIAAIDDRGPQSVTSEVFLTVGASGLVSVPPTQERNLQPQTSSNPLPKGPGSAALDLGQWSEQGKQDMKREPSRDKLEYKSEDDDVFEDVQSALTRLRRNK